MLERFTERAKRVVEIAHQEAQRRHERVVGTGHLLLAIVKEGSGVGAGVLTSTGVSRAMSGERTDTLLESPQKSDESREAAGLGETIARAKEEARELNHAYVGTEHILLAIVGQENGAGARLLVEAGINLQAVRDLVLLMVGVESPTALSARGEPQTWQLEEKTMVFHGSAPGPAEGPGDMFGPGAVDQAVHQAVNMCWMLLPPEKKSVAGVEREIRRIVDRVLANLREDSKSFGIPDDEDPESRL